MKNTPTLAGLDIVYNYNIKEIANPMAHTYMLHDNVLFLTVIQSNCTQLSSSANGQIVPCDSNAVGAHYE